MPFRNIILVQPADNLYLTALFDVEIVLFNVVDKMIDYPLPIHHREIEQQFRVVICLLEQGGKNVIQRIALLDK